MKKEIETFFEEVRKSIAKMPKRPPIIVKEGKITGIKLNSAMIEKLSEPRYAKTIDDENYTTYLMGTRVYRDDTVSKPIFIVEGEIDIIKHTLSREQALEEENDILLGQNSDLYDKLFLANKQYKELMEYAELHDKILKIIFEKNVNMEEIFESEDVVEYNKRLLPSLQSCNSLTEEEFNTLKKAHSVLKL